MKNPKPQRPLTSTQIMIQIMDDIEKIKIGGRFNYKYTPETSLFTKAISVSIENTCNRLGLKLNTEVEFLFSDKFKKKNKKKYGGIVDFTIINPNGQTIVIELDSRNKKLSYEKLEELSKRGYDTYWILWRRNVTGTPYESSYKDDYGDYYIKRGYTNENVGIMKHIFHPTSFKTLC